MSRATDRWKLELTGTSPQTAPWMEATLDEIGWRRWPTEVRKDLGVTRIYIETDRGESAQSILVELIDHGMPYTTPAIAKAQPLNKARLLMMLDAARLHARIHAGPKPPA